MPEAEIEVEVDTECAQGNERVRPEDICVYGDKARRFLSKKRKPQEAKKIVKNLEEKLWNAWESGDLISSAFISLCGMFLVNGGKRYGALVRVIDITGSTGNPPYEVVDIQGNIQDISRH